MFLILLHLCKREIFFISQNINKDTPIINSFYAIQNITYFRQCLHLRANCFVIIAFCKGERCFFNCRKILFKYFANITFVSNHHFANLINHVFSAFYFFRIQAISCFHKEKIFHLFGFLTFRNFIVCQNLFCGAEVLSNGKGNSQSAFVIFHDIHKSSKYIREALRITQTSID